MKGTAELNKKVVTMIKPQAAGAGTVTGDAVDCKGFGEALIVVHAGTVPSNGTLDVHLEESSASGSGFGDITSATFTQVTASNDETLYVGRLNLRGCKRYIRAIAVVANQTIPLSVEAVLSEAVNEPVTQVNTVAFSLNP